MQTLDSQFIEISITLFQRMLGRLPFNIFIRRGPNKFTKLFRENDFVDFQRMDLYQHTKGVLSLYVLRDNYKTYLQCVDEIANRLLADDTVPPAEIAGVVKELSEISGFEMAVNLNLQEEVVSLATTAIKACIDLLAEHPKEFIKILRLINKHPYTLKHAVSTALFSVLLGRYSKVDNERLLSLLGLGAFLHDIGMSMLPFDAEMKAELSGEEWRLVKEHPHLSKRILDQIPTISDEIKLIALQHHEQPNGQGYPNNLLTSHIYFFAKIVGIADSFSSLVSRRPFRDVPYTPLRAIEIMRLDHGKFDEGLLSQFEAIFKRAAATSL